MSLRSEVIEAMAAVKMPVARRLPILAVIDEYEGAEVQKYPMCEGYLRTRESGFWDHNKPSFTVYRKKQKPKPDVTELARRAVKAWRGGTYATHEAMHALAEAVDE